MRKQKLLFLGDSLTSGVYSDGKMRYDRVNYPQMIAAMYEKKNLLDSYYNAAVSGFTTLDVISILEDDLTYNENIAYNIVGEYTYKKGLRDYHHTARLIKEDIKIRDLIRKSDQIIMTLGSNDFIKFFKKYQDRITKIIQNDEDNKLIGKTTNEILNNYHHLFETIYILNPKIKITLIGSYVPHRSKYLQSLFYDMFSRIEKQISEDLTTRYPNFHFVSVIDGFKLNADTFLDNPLNIHPNKLGYTFMAKRYEEDRGIY